MIPRRVSRSSDGTFRLRLPEEARALLRSLAGELRALLTDGASDGDPVLQRLFPPAYADDPQRNAEYGGLVRDDLLRHRLEGLAELEAAASADRVDAEQLERCVGALNDLRLVLGTRLDTNQDMDWEALSPEDPDFGAYVAYDFLTELQGEVLEALTRERTW